MERTVERTRSRAPRVSRETPNTGRHDGMPGRRDDGRGRVVERRRGHRREVDARRPRRRLEARLDGVVRDVGAFRAVALPDLVERQFDGHPFAARCGLARAEREGWITLQPACGPRGGTYTVVVATPAGATRAAALWREAGRRDQRTYAGAVRPAELSHDIAVYRAACAAQARIEAADGRVTRVRLDAELKGRLAAAAERARQMAGARAADAERRRLAEALGLPVDERGRVLVPDAQVEYVDPSGHAARCNVEVASGHYRGRAIRAKAQAGFALYAATARAAAVVRRALGGGRGGRRGGGRLRQEPEVFEL